MYVKIRSWHIVNGDKTLCGRKYGPSDRRTDDMPAEASCESCFRVQESRRR